MKSLRIITAVGMLAAASSVARADMPVVQMGDLHMEIGGLGQPMAATEFLQDPYKDNVRAYAFLQTARLRMDGGYKDYTFNLELELTGQDNIVAVTDPWPNLLDLAFNIPIHIPGLGESFFKFGQFLVPYGRENLTYPGQMQFVSPSIQHLGFDVGRDVGATVNLRNNWATGIFGIFTGGGRDVPEEFLPEKLGVPLLVARIGVGNLDEDPYYLHQNDLKADHLQGGIYVNGFYTKDSLVGHSTLLNVKEADKGLLLNANWNPYIGMSTSNAGAAVYSQGNYWQTGIDGAIRDTLGHDMSANGEAEFDYGGFSNAYGGVHLASLRVQGGFQFHNFEVALRYAMLLPDKDFASTGTAAAKNAGVQFPFTGTAPISEITPAISYYFFGQNLKAIIDAPFLVNDPVTIEKNVGAYSLTDLPNQSTVAANGAGGLAAHQNVEQIRLMVQAQF